MPVTEILRFAQDDREERRVTFPILIVKVH